jgi:hypothetical protein
MRSHSLLKISSVLATALLCCAAARAQSCKTYFPNPTIFPFFSTLGGAQYVTVATVNGTVQPPVMTPIPTSGPGAILWQNPRNIADGIFGANGDGLFQSCAGVFPSAGPESISPPNPDFSITETLSSSNGTMNITVQGTIIVLNLNGSCPYTCLLDQGGFTFTYAYNIQSGGYTIQANSSEHTIFVDDNGNTFDSVTTLSGSASGVWALQVCNLGLPDTLIANPGGPFSYDDPPRPTAMTASFFPPSQTLIAAAQACGYTGFNWQQVATHFADFNLVYPGYNAPNFDPPTSPPAPFYYTPAELSANTSVDDTALAFSDRPSNNLLANNDYMAFTTRLVGLTSSNPNGVILATWTWTSNYNYYSGGTTCTNPGDICINAATTLPDNNGGTGGAIMTSFNGISVLPSPSSGTACNGVYDGTFKGDITVSSGQSCRFVGGTIAGHIHESGGTLILTGVRVDGHVHIDGGAFSIGPNTTINGDLHIRDIPVGTAQNLVCGSTVSGDLHFKKNDTPVEIGSASASSCEGNVIGRNLEVEDNAGATIIEGNSVSGDLRDDNNTASTQVFNNVVKKSLQCENDTSITGGGNTAERKEGQCSSF